MATPGPYHNERFAFATVHAKGRAIAKPFKRRRGAFFNVPAGIDTDGFGTFTGEVAPHGAANPRSWPPRNWNAARNADLNDSNLRRAPELADPGQCERCNP